MSKQSEAELIRETNELIAHYEGSRVARLMSKQAQAQAPAPAPQRKIRVTAKRQANQEYKNASPGDLAIANLFIFDLWWDKMTENQQIFYQTNGVALERDFDAYLQTLPEPARRCINRVVAK